MSSRSTRKRKASIVGKPEPKNKSTIKNKPPVDRTAPLSFEQEKAWNKGTTWIIGADEAGRGSAAGPVVVCGYMMRQDTPIVSGIRDSKKISTENRRLDYSLRLTNHATRVPQLSLVPMNSQSDVKAYYAIAEMDNKRVDEINVLEASMEGMAQVVQQLEQSIGPNEPKPYILIDGDKIPKQLLDAEHKGRVESIIKGDALSYCIAAASVIAKNHRDRLMRNKVHVEFPQYQFDKHKGYPTVAHKAALEQYGTCPYHRQ